MRGKKIRRRFDLSDLSDQADQADLTKSTQKILFTQYQLVFFQINIQQVINFTEAPRRIFLEDKKLR